MNIFQTMAFVVVALCVMMFPCGQAVAADQAGADQLAIYKLQYENTQLRAEIIKGEYEKIQKEAQRLKGLIVQATSGGPAAKGKGKK